VHVTPIGARRLGTFIAEALIRLANADGDYANLLPKRMSEGQ